MLKRIESSKEVECMMVWDGLKERKTKFRGVWNWSLSGIMDPRLTYGSMTHFDFICSNGLMGLCLGEDTTLVDPSYLDGLVDLDNVELKVDNSDKRRMSPLFVDELSTFNSTLSKSTSPSK
jgi:hypothetical protein